MRLAKPLLILGVIVMAGAIIYAFIVGHFFDEAKVLFTYPWFHVTMIDLYVGFLLFSGWIVSREQSLGVALIWVALLMCLGNLLACAYALLALAKAKGNLQTFWMGQPAHE